MSGSGETGRKTQKSCLCSRSINNYAKLEERLRWWWAFFFSFFFSIGFKLHLNDVAPALKCRASLRTWGYNHEALMEDIKCIQGWGFPLIEPERRVLRHSIKYPRATCAHCCFYHWIHCGGCAKDITSSLHPLPKQSTTQSPLFHHTYMTISFPHHWYAVLQLTEDEILQTGKSNPCGIFQEKI